MAKIDIDDPINNTYETCANTGEPWETCTCAECDAEEEEAADWAYYGDYEMEEHYRTGGVA